VLFSSGYLWQVAPQQSLRPFHPMPQSYTAQFNAAIAR